MDNRAVSYRTDIPEPRPPDGEALIRISHAGICSTDHGLIDGMYPFTGVLGHEFVGRVEGGPDNLVGKRVVGVISASCHSCPTCVAGRTSHCPNRTVLGIQNRNGVFADYTLLPSCNLIVVPDSVPSEVAVFTEPLAAALQILEQVHIKPSDEVLLVGPGKLGQLVARILMGIPCALTIGIQSDSSVERLPRGVRTCKSDDVPEAFFDVVIECTGRSAGFGAARRGVRPGGTMVLKSTHRADTPFDMTMAVVDEIRVVGSRCGPFPPALKLLEEGRLDPRPLIDATFSLDAGLEALEVSRQPGSLKVLINCL